MKWYRTAAQVRDRALAAAFLFSAFDGVIISHRYIERIQSKRAFISHSERAANPKLADSKTLFCYLV